ncbi:N-acetyltransferase family protein [Planococcus sp. FY231025]|uniref:GNAT family N-acetyltransferase n=1 Tax=Planococcus sp. FY231025 TaxID=3455699 RepID=UPI003F918037
MEIKRATESDLAKCTETFTQVFNEAPWNDRWVQETAARYLLDFFRTPGFTGMLATENGEVLGFLFGAKRTWWSGDEFFINEMCVRGDRQNRGIGTALLERLVKELGADDVTHLSLLTDRGIPAEEFYRRNGFSEIDRLVFMTRGLE